MSNKTSRMIESEWQKVITRTRDSLIRCPKCGEETFIEVTAGKAQCMNCGGAIETKCRVKLGNRELVLMPKMRLHIDNDNVPDAQVITNPNDSSLMLLQNLMKTKWTAETPSGKIKEVEPNGYMPVKNGIKITFSPLLKGEIITD